MSYSSDEKSDAVEALVQGTLSYPRDPLGPRDQSTEFTEVMETVYAVLLYDLDAIYYLIYLTRNKLKSIIRAETSLCDELLDAIDDLSMPNKPVDNISSLSSARNSLQAIDSALERSGSVAGSEFRRYQQALTKFKNEVGKSVKMTYVPRGSTTPVKDIVRPSARAKVDTSIYFSSLKEEHERFLTQLSNIQGALSGFDSGGLTSAIGRLQIARARAQLEDLNDLLEGLTAEERIAEARGSLLTAMANESVVKALANQPTSGSYKFQQKPASSPTYRISAYGEGTAPTSTGSKSAPFPLYDSLAAAPTNKLGFTSLNGSAFEVDLFPTASPSYKSGIQQASVTGWIDGPFEIHDDIETPIPLATAVEPFFISVPTGVLHLVVDGTAYECLLSTGGSQTAANVKADLDLVGNWKNSIKPEITTSVSGGRVYIEYDVASPPAKYSNRYMRVVQGFQYASGLENWQVGGADNTITRGWDANNELCIKANADPSYVTVSLPEGNSVSASSVVSAIDSAGGSEFTAQVDGDKVEVLSEHSGEGSIITIVSEGYGTPSFLGMTKLGLSEGQETRESDIDGLVVTNMLNGDSNFSAEAVARMARTDLLSSRRATFYSASTLSISSTTDPTGDWPSDEIKLVVTNGDNRGIYTVDSYSWSGGILLVTLDRTLRDDTATLLHTVSIYSEVLQIASNDAGLTGVIDLEDPTGSARTVLGFDGSANTATVGELLIERNDAVYGWRAEDISRLRIRVGDAVLDGGGNEQATVSSLSKLSDGILIVSSSLSPSFQLSTAGFGIQSGAYIAYLAFISDLEDWVTNDLSPYEDDLGWIDRALGRLLLTTPTRDGVDVAYTRVSLLKSKLESLDTICDSFTVSRIAAVDSALQSLLEHGYDRARQLLITGQVGEFFSTAAAKASFSKAFQAAANDIVVQDINRASAAKARFDAEFVRFSGGWEEDKHPDFDFSDLEEEPPDDVVLDYYQGVDEFEGT